MIDPNSQPTAETRERETVEYLQRSLGEMLYSFFDTTDEHLIDEIRRRVSFSEVRTGEVLLREGEHSDDVYFVLSGRLRAVLTTAPGRETALGEIGRGEVVGELALILGEPRSASVIAIRDSLVAKLTRAGFEEVVHMQPKLALSMARSAVERLRSAERRRQPHQKPVSVTILPIDRSVNAADFAERLVRSRAEYGDPVRLVTSEDFAREFGNTTPSSEAIGDWLTSIEASAECVVLLAEHDHTPWTDHSVHQADEVLLLANFDSTPVVTDAEKSLFDGDNPAPVVRQSLVLLHPPDRRSPTGTARWLDRREVSRHFHIREDNTSDLRRLARTLAGRAIGIVLAGGGARSFVHFGVLNALTDAGIVPDFIGGTSMGAAVGALAAMGLTKEPFLQAGRNIFLDKPTSDFNLLPILSLIRGHRVRHITERAVIQSAGESIGIEDTWIPFFCIATDLSASEEAVLKRGPLDKSLLASFSIPGALPPILLNNHIMVDGATFNNFPVDVMEALGAGTIIGVAYLEPAVPHVGLTELPGSLALLRDLFRPEGKRKFRLPTLPEILIKSTVTASTQRQKRAMTRVDWMIQPEVVGVGMLDWERIDEVADRSQLETEGLLKQLDPELLESLKR